MVVKDIQNLLDKFFADGFTMDCLCKATNVPPDLIRKAYDKEKLDMDEIMALNPVLYFLTQLYLCDTSTKAYLEDVSTVMCEYYKMPMNAVSNYLGLDEAQYQAFLNDPEKYSNGYNLTVRLLHLFISLVREKE